MLYTTKKIHIVIGLILAAALFSSTSFAMNAVNWNLNVFKQLNYGIYWFKYDPVTNKSKVTKASSKTAKSNCHAKGANQCFYDATKPTMIFFHGYVPFSVKNRMRQDFTFTNPATKKSTNTLKAWKQKGWNVGIFYWNQFTDDLPFRTISKIYTAKNHETGQYDMYWTKYISPGKSALVKNTGIKQNMTQLALANYKNAMEGYQGNNIRVVGHSLGAQLVTQFTRAVNIAVNKGALATNLMPNRLVLLDPVFSPLPTTYLPNHESTAEANYHALKKMLSADNPNRLKTVAEYRSSWWSFPTSSAGLKINKMVALTRYMPNYIKKSYFPNIFFYWLIVHDAARFIYFDSFAHNPPPLLGQDGGAPSAATSAKRIQQLMGLGKKDQLVLQVAGNNKGVDTSRAKFKLAKMSWIR